MNFSDRDEMQVLAGEYVLGLLDDEEKSDFERALATSIELATDVAFWQDRLLAIVPAPAAADPGAALWQTIEARLDPAKSSAPVSRARPSAARSATSMWDSLKFWRTVGLAGMLASALLALRLFTALPENTGPEYLAVLVPMEQGVTWVVKVDADAVRLSPLGPVTVEQGKAIQFWTKPEGAAGPTSLGLVAADREVTVPRKKLPGMGANQLFEVTLEPETGSPLDRPTGPILAVGKAIRL